MRCEEIMKTNVECVSRDATVVDAARRMRASNIGFLPVCDEAGKVLGTLTDRDLAIRVIADERDPETPVSDVMTREVVACSPGDDLERAEELLGAYQKSRIMCIDAEGHLSGVISLSDIAQYDESENASRTLREVSEREAHA